MNILMLGWEYPPHITGGLGTACQGLTTALTGLGISIDFIVPQLIGDETAPHMNLIESSRGLINRGGRVLGSLVKKERLIRQVGIPAYLAPYWDEKAYFNYVAMIEKLGEDVIDELLPNLSRFPRSGNVLLQAPATFAGGYGSNLFREIEFFSRNVIKLMLHASFDIIHAHDWITFPAGVALARMTNKPLVVHVHSLEVDRSGGGANPKIVAVEAKGLQAATKIIAVSKYTASLIQREHGISSEKIDVVHNGMHSNPVALAPRSEWKWKGKTVLFLGRVTYQKGPEYFVEAAAKVLTYCPDTLFVVAGSGDMLPRMVDRVHDLGISSNFKFTGFLRGSEVDKMFALADLYVMPSVSEPFGLTALEAIKCGTPVIVSKTSGVSEVLPHVFKVDYWDTNRIANRIIDCILDEELGKKIVNLSQADLNSLRWEAAAEKVCGIYEELSL
jgi:glycogen synthase